jgi:hypothetical protein
MSVDDVFKDMYIPFDCDFLVAQLSGDVHVSLTEVYQVQYYLPLQKSRVAEWSSTSGFTWTDASFYERRGDLQGLPIIASVYPQVS